MDYNNAQYIIILQYIAATLKSGVLYIFDKNSSSLYNRIIVSFNNILLIWYRSGLDQYPSILSI